MRAAATYRGARRNAVRDQRATQIVRKALLRGEFLSLNGQGWKLGRRRFAFKTVARLIDDGEAIRVGKHVVAWRPA